MICPECKKDLYINICDNDSCQLYFIYYSDTNFEIEYFLNFGTNSISYEQCCDNLFDKIVVNLNYNIVETNVNKLSFNEAYLALIKIKDSLEFL